MTAENAENQTIDPDIIARYTRPDLKRATGQLLNSIIPYFALIVLMYFSLSYSYWLTLALAIPTGGFMVRIFIIFHDCGHGSFFKSKKLNQLFGWITGIITLSPYHNWRFNHARHHATCSDLDRRGLGDVWTMTVAEYRALSKKERIGYRLYRNPFIMFLLGPVNMWGISMRFAPRDARKRERNSVHITNLALAVIILTCAFTIGIKAYLMIQLPIMLFGGMAGIWLFYVQHQFEDVYWDRNEEWDFERAAIEGSSFYKLPGLLRWFSGNIGFHHIHHLNSRIPNYHLQACHNSIAAFRNVKPVTLRGSLKSLKFRLWDERTKRLVGFKEAFALPVK